MHCNNLDGLVDRPVLTKGIRPTRAGRRQCGIQVFDQSVLMPNYPLAVGGYTFQGYSALYTVILNLIVTVVLTPVFNAMGAAQTDATFAADYHA